MADHAVRRIDRLVAENTGQSGNQQPEQRRHDTIGKIFGEAFDCGAADTGFVQAGRVATDNHRYGLTACLDTFLLQRISNGPDMRIKAALGKKRAGQGSADNGARQPGKEMLRQQKDGHPRKSADGEQQKQRAKTKHPAATERKPLTVPGPVAPCYQRPDPADGMADPAIKGVRKSERGFDGKRSESEFGKHA